MATLRDIKRRINAVKGTAKITQAMKMVAAAKLKRAQKAIESARPYVLKLSDMLSNLITAIANDYSHPLIKNPDEVKNIAVIVIASDRGLCGSFNNNLFRDVKNYIEGPLKEEYPDANINIVPVGLKTVQYFKKQSYNVIKEFPGIFKDLDYSHAQEIVNTVKPGFINDEIDKVLIYFNEFVSSIRQDPKRIQLLPIESAEEQLAENQKFSKKSDRAEEKPTGQMNAEYIFEPDKESILDVLLPKLIDIKVWRTLLESHAAEHAARMMAMDNATTNAKDLIQNLELKYNKARQQSITTEMLEIVSGAEALSNG